MGAEGAIPWTAIDAFATRAGLDGDAFDRFLKIIRAADGEYLRIKSGQIAEAREAQKRLDEEASLNSGEEEARRISAAMARKRAAQV